MSGLYEILEENSYIDGKSHDYKDIVIAQTHSGMTVIHGCSAQISVPPIILKWPYLRFNLGRIYATPLANMTNPATEQRYC